MLVEDSPDQPSHLGTFQALLSDADHGRATVAPHCQQGVEVRIEGHCDTVVFSTPGEERLIISGREANLTRVNDVVSPLAQQPGRATRHALIEEVLHEAVGRSAVSPPTMAAA